MISVFKNFIKKNIPSRYLEFFSYKAISITKIPDYKGAVISDLFILRLEDGWETYFECLKFNNIFNPNEKVNQQRVVFCFYKKTGQYILEREVKLSASIKTTLNINQLVHGLNLKEDCLFAIFHPQNKYWIRKHNSFLAERGYIGYANPNLGKIKGFVHGNLDAIARNTSTKEDQLLGNFSFFKKEYRLQHILVKGNTYELFLVNPTQKKQELKIIQKTSHTSKETITKIPSNGFFKHCIKANEKEGKINVSIESNLYLARPVVFKIMRSSFDVFHG